MADRCTSTRRKPDRRLEEIGRELTNIFTTNNKQYSQQRRPKQFELRPLSTQQQQQQKQQQYTQQVCKFVGRFVRDALISMGRK